MNGIDIPKGTLLQIPVYAIHHYPEVWPEPEKFNPYRYECSKLTIHLSFFFCLDFFLKKLVNTCPFYGVTDTRVLYFV